MTACMAGRALRVEGLGWVGCGRMSVAIREERRAGSQVR